MKQWKVFRERTGYRIKGVSSMSGKWIVAIHQSETGILTILSIRVPSFVMVESRLCTTLTCILQHVRNFIFQSIFQESTSTNTFFVTKDIENECLELSLRNKPKQELFKEQVYSSIAFRKRQLKKIDQGLQNVVLCLSWKDKNTVRDTLLKTTMFIQYFEAKMELSSMHPLWGGNHL